MKHNRFEEITEIPDDAITIIATGPCFGRSCRKIIERFGTSLSFFDAAAPIVSAKSIDMDYAFYASDTIKAVATII